MGQFSVKTYNPPGSLLSATQHVNGLPAPFARPRPRSRVDHDRFVAVPPIGRGGWNDPVPQTKEKYDDERN